MPGLKDSRWALRDGRSSSVPASSSRPPVAGQGRPDEDSPTRPESRPRDFASAAAELSRYSKIVRRMKWKLPFLDLAYRQATTDPPGHGAAVLEAELMFKLDFFEYYMLCERALVHLQGVYGITISRDTLGGTSKPVAAYVGKKSPHRYHANVLEALDRNDNPLHEILGAEDVRRQLQRAKDLRNRWKNADDCDGEDATDSITGKRPTKTVSPPLSSYDLAVILTSIHEALDRAFISTRDFVANEGGKSSAASAKASEEKLSGTDMGLKGTEAEEAEDWEFMVDAMDWEAV